MMSPFLLKVTVTELGYLVLLPALSLIGGLAASAKQASRFYQTLLSLTAFGNVGVAFLIFQEMYWAGKCWKFPGNRLRLIQIPCPLFNCQRHHLALLLIVCLINCHLFVLAATQKIPMRFDILLKKKCNRYFTYDSSSTVVDLFLFTFSVVFLFYGKNCPSDNRQRLGSF